MSDQQKRHPLNVSGRYYVDHTCCVNNEYCVYNAPNNFRIDPTLYHGAYVFKQPDSPEEEAQCRKAMEQCPFGAVRDDGES